MSSSNDIEAIKTLKYSYFRNVDQKNLDALEQQLLPECSTSYHGGRYGNPDRASTVAFLRTALGPHLLTMHQAHHPEIELLSATEARGRWYMHDIVINLKDNTRLEGNGFYEDRYRKVDGQWKFAHTGYHRTFALTQPLGEVLDLYSAFEQPTSVNMGTALAPAGASGRAFDAMWEALWRQDALPPAALELCRLRLAQLHGADAELARRNTGAALADSKRAALLRGDFLRDEQFSAGERAVLEFAEIYAQDPSAITDELAFAVKEYFGDPGLVVLVKALGFIDGRIRMARLLGSLNAQA